MKQIYEGYEIEVTEQMKFKVVGAGFAADDEGFDSIDRARQAVDTVKKVLVKKQTLDFKVMNRKGDEARITGINMHTGKVTTKPVLKFSRWRGEDDSILYPAIAGLVPLIAEKERLKAQLATIEKTLNAVELDADRGNVRAEHYSEKLQELADRYGECVEAAKKLVAKNSKKSARDL